MLTLTDHAKAHRLAVINGTPVPPTTMEAKIAIATRYLGNRHVLNGGNPDWSRPVVLPAWIASRPGALQRIAGCNAYNVTTTVGQRRTWKLA